MNHTQSYTINGCIFQEFLALLGRIVHSDLIRQMEHLKVENEILRAKCPKRITTSPAEKRRLIRYGLACRGKIKGIISIVSYSTKNLTSYSKTVIRELRRYLTARQTLTLMPKDS